jgi:hypothetical protein
MDFYFVLEVGVFMTFSIVQFSNHGPYGRTIVQRTWLNEGVVMDTSCGFYLINKLIKA